MNVLRTLIAVTLALLITTGGCQEPYVVPPIEQLAIELRNPDFQWNGPCARMDRIPVLHAARALACIGDKAVPTLLDAAEDPNVDIISIYDALFEIGLPVSEYYDDLMARDMTRIREWWDENGDRTRVARNELRRSIGLPPIRRD